MKREIVQLIVVLLLMSVGICQAQSDGYQVPKDNYRTAYNPYYWKNRKPFEGYWQQDVYYKIDAVLDDKTDIISGDESLTYYNNSPDELNFVFFHLYQNAFQPKSPLDNLQKHNGVAPYYGHYEKQGLGTKIDTIFVEGRPMKHEIDYSVMKVWLEKPLKSGESVTFKIKFKTFYDSGSTRRRMKKFMVAGGFKHYDGVLWYPRICVYDRKFGWDTNQHLNREFYGDYGTFDVNLTLPNFYVAEATGVLQNRQEVLPDSLRKLLDIANFKDKKWDSQPSIPILPDSTTKTWRFHSENTHDFAFTCDPTYRIGETEWNGIKCISLCQEAHAARWQNAAEYLRKIIITFSHDIGLYAYPKIIVADAQDGMEYPMLTLDGGGDPDYRSTLVHEVGHNWFYGMVGNNETYRACMDEGFTQFYTAWGMDRIDGNYEASYPIKSGYVRHFYHKPTNIYKRVYYAYLKDAMHGDETTINTHSDYFGGALNHGGGYGQVYYKTATMLYNLEYVLGDSLFMKAMQNYFNQWKMCHPYPEDFRNSIVNYTHADVNWFFDGWMETNKTVDYGIKCVKKDKKKDAMADDYVITFQRYGRLQMPLDFRVYAKDGRTYDYYIPCNWWEKKTDAKVLPKWEGWDKLRPRYKAHVNVPSGIDHVQIDTTYRLADVNLLDNASHCPVKLKWDSHIYSMPDWKHYELYARPDVWYNQYDGFKAGVHLNGNYMDYKHVFSLNIWGNTGLYQQPVPKNVDKNGHDVVSYRFNYKTPVTFAAKNTFAVVNAKYLDGLQSYYVGGEKTFDEKPNTKVYFGVKAMYRHDSSDAAYLLNPELWQTNKWNNTVNAGIQHNYSYKHGSGVMNLTLRSSTLLGNYDYATLTYVCVNKNQVGKFDFNTRFFAQYASGSNIPDESALYLAGGNPEEAMENKYTRSRGFIDNNWLGYGANTNHFQEGGGLNLRGFAGYWVIQQRKDGSSTGIYKGSSGSSVNGELGFDRLFAFLRPRYVREYIKLHTYLFADAGVINDNANGEKMQVSDVRADAGVGIALTIKKFGALQGVNPLTIRVDMPVFLNRTPASSPDNLQFRWIVGVNRCF